MDWSIDFYDSWLIILHSPPVRQNSGHSTPRTRPPATTLNIPGMTKSRVSPDGKIAQRDVGAKLVVIMVGLPARGKSYITKKIQRYLSWQQHETRIFNVGNRRRVAAGASTSVPSALTSPQKQPPRRPSVNVIRTSSIQGVIDRPTLAAHMILNGVEPTIKGGEPIELPRAETMVCLLISIFRLYWAILIPIFFRSNRPSSSTPRMRKVSYF